MTDDTRKQVVDIGKAKTTALLMERRNELAHRALEMRQAGHSYYEIAVELGLPETESKRLVAESIAHAARLVDEATKAEILFLEVSRLDALQAAAWPRAMEGNVSSGEYVLKIIQARMKALQVGETSIVSNTLNAVVVPANEEQYAQALRLIASGGQR